MKKVRWMVLIFLMLAVAAIEAPASAQQINAVTRVRIFTPFSPTGLNSGLTVKERVNGSCMAGSLADASRVDAWRCSAGNQMYDPCFENSFGERGLLACVQMPWTNSVTMLRPDFTPARTPRTTKAIRAKSFPGRWNWQTGSAACCSPGPPALLRACASITSVRMVITWPAPLTERFRYGVCFTNPQPAALQWIRSKSAQPGFSRTGAQPDKCLLAPGLP